MLSFVAAAAFLKLSGFSVSSIVGFMSSFTMKVIVGSSSSGIMAALVALAGYFIYAIASIAMLTLAFSFLASYGYACIDKRFSVTISALGGIIFFLFLGISLASLLCGLAVFVSTYMIMPLANNYGNELKSWVHFRIGSNSMSRALFVFNLMIALAVFLAVLIGQPQYELGFKSDLRQAMTSIVSGSLPLGVDPSVYGPMIDERITAFLDSPLIASYTTWLPVFATLIVWALLELARLFLPYLAGFFTSLLIKIENM